MGVDKSAEIVMGIATVAKVALQMVAELDFWKQSEIKHDIAADV